MLVGNGGILPSELLRPSLTNQKGFYESWYWVNANDNILGDIGLRWDSIIPTPKIIECNSFINSKKNLIIESIRKGFSGQYNVNAPLIIKDPRICRTFPIWEKALMELKIEINLLIPVRHPFEVIHSLELRDGIRPIEACYIWIWNVIESLIFSKNQKPKFVNYEKVLENPRSYLSEVLSTAVDDKCSSIVDVRLNHNFKARDYYKENEEPFYTAMNLYERIQSAAKPSLELIEFCTQLHFHSQYLLAKEKRKNKRLINGLLKNSLIENDQQNKTFLKWAAINPITHIMKIMSKFLASIKNCRSLR